MDGDDARREIEVFNALESGTAHAGGEFALGGEFTNTFNEILIALAVAGHELADAWYEVEGKRVIAGGDEGLLDPAEFHAKEPSAGL